MLLASGNYISATGLVRLQFEALVRAMWLLYSASDTAVSKLMSELTSDSVRKANKLPMLSEMLNKLVGKSPQEPLDMLLEFKEYSWRPLSSFVHGGIHAINRHSKGYPIQLLSGMLKNSNGISMMTGNLLVILHGGREQVGKISNLQQNFSDCLPEHKYKDS